MGSCDFTYIWIGDVTEKHVTTNSVQIKFILYRDDARDILVQKREFLLTIYKNKDNDFAADMHVFSAKNNDFAANSKNGHTNFRR